MTCLPSSAVALPEASSQMIALHHGPRPGAAPLGCPAWLSSNSFGGASLASVAARRYQRRGGPRAAAATRSAVEPIARPTVEQTWSRLGAAERPEQRLDEEWLRLGLSFIQDATRSPTNPSHASQSLDDIWLQMGLTRLPWESNSRSLELSSLDDTWLHLGLTKMTPPDMSPPVLLDEPEGGPIPLPSTSLSASASTLSPVAAPTAADAQEEALREKAAHCFATDLRPIVLFDGSCNFCSKWTVFLLDTDPLGNLRFASMQSEAGRALLKGAGLKVTDTSEIVLATHKGSFVGVEAILTIFSRLTLPFPIIAAIGSVSPLALSNAVYKFVSKNRHRWSGPSACRLFDQRFNERFVS